MDFFILKVIFVFLFNIVFEDIFKIEDLVNLFMLIIIIYVLKLVFF